MNIYYQDLQSSLLKMVCVILLKLNFQSSVSQILFFFNLKNNLRTNKSNNTPLKCNEKQPRDSSHTEAREPNAGTTNVCVSGWLKVADKHWIS